MMCIKQLLNSNPTIIKLKLNAISLTKPAVNESNTIKGSKTIPIILFVAKNDKNIAICGYV